MLTARCKSMEPDLPCQMRRRSETDTQPRAAPENESVIEAATRILMARRDCTPDGAYVLLIDAAHEHDMPVWDIAACLVANQQLR